MIRFGVSTDCSALVHAHLQTFGVQENLAVRLGPAYLRAVYRWFLSSPETYVLQAMVEGELGAWTAVCDRPYNQPMLRATWPAFLAGLVTHPRALDHPEFKHRLVRVLSGRPTAGRHDDDPPRLAFLAYIATMPMYRGRGLGLQLLEAAKIASCERGADFLRSGIFRGNDASLGMFRKAGFALLERPCTDTHMYVQVDLR